MKPEELRLNNWYYSVKWKQPVRCELSDLAQLDYECQGAQLDADIISQMFEPIELTEEWLLKLGAKYEFYTTYPGYFLPEIDGFRIRIAFEDNKFWYYITTDTKIELKYVHRLQNLYFELRNNELNVH